MSLRYWRWWANTPLPVEESGQKGLGPSGGISYLLSGGASGHKNASETLRIVTFKKNGCGIAHSPTCLSQKELGNPAKLKEGISIIGDS